MGLDLRESIMDCLRKNAGHSLLTRDIALWIWKHRNDACQKKLSQSRTLRTEAKFLNQLVCDVSARRKALQSRYPEVWVSTTRPVTYCWKSEACAVATVQSLPACPEQRRPFNEIQTNAQHEAALYPLLIKALAAELGVRARTIDHRRMKGRRARNLNAWLFPDIVGSEDLAADWQDEVRANAKSAKRLWSFEVKDTVPPSSARRDFFQALSNSSWANVGYLVAREFDQNAAHELRLLAKSHGIGIMQVNRSGLPSFSERLNNKAALCRAGAIRARFEVGLP